MRTVPGRTDRIVIIGAGLGGLSAALHLAGRGRQVTVLERGETPGGRAGLARIDDYALDTGPSVLTMPDVIEATFAAVGETMTDWLTLHRLDPAYRARFADGSTIDVCADPVAMTEQIRVTCGAANAAGFVRFADWLTALYNVQFDQFIDRNLDHVRDLDLRSIARLATLGGFRHLGPKVASFLPDERLQRLFSFQALYAGVAPARALALYAVITYLDSVQGVYFPTGGLHALPRALAAAATKHGVDIRYGVTAERIEHDGGRASAVITTDGERVPADVIVVNADLPGAYAQLLSGARPTRRQLTFSPACVLVHLGTSARASAHHEISFGAAWASTFSEIIDHGRLMSDPSFLVSSPTFTDPTLAPAGHHLQQVLFPAPNLDVGHVEWADSTPAYLDHIVTTLAARGFDVTGAEVLDHRTPADWAAAGLAAGTPFAAAHTFRQTGPFRAATIDRRLSNVLRCGSQVQPGVGIPMALISGRLAAQRVPG